jgi:alkylation response protein AidB-like acyl-CoA dehydrogenase
MIPVTCHSTALFDSESAAKILIAAPEAEQSARLHVNQLEVIYEKQLFKTFIPGTLGGLGLSLPEVLRTEECISCADGSTGWVVTLCSGAGWFVGFIDPAITADFFNDRKTCIAGSGSVTGVAEMVDGGYVITGKWSYASGALHATAFTVNCYIHQNKQQLYNSNGSPKVCAFILKPHEVNILKTWNSMGMIATASHSFEVAGVYVNANRCFIIDPNLAFLSDVIYQYPFLQFAETTLAVNISGMAMRFLDLCDRAMENRPGSINHKMMCTDARNEFVKSNKDFFFTVGRSWEELTSKKIIHTNTLLQISSSSLQLVTTSRKIVNSLFPLCGLSATDLSSEINRVWRNFHTASQHALFNR